MKKWPLLGHAQEGLCSSEHNVPRLHFRLPTRTGRGENKKGRMIFYFYCSLETHPRTVPRVLRHGFRKPRIFFFSRFLSFIPTTLSLSAPGGVYIGSQI